MDDGTGMAVAKGDHDLFEDWFALGFWKHAFFFNVLEKIAFTGVFHDD